MSDAPAPSSRPDGDGAAGSPLGRLAAGGVAVVAVAALAFWGIGTLGGDTDDPVVADRPEDGADDGADDATPPDDGTDPPPDVPPEDDAGTDGADSGEGGDDAAEDDGTGDDGDADDADGGEDGDEPDEVERTVEPGEVTVQVLDGYKSDGGAAAGAVADLLDGEGYDIIARNDALDYATTTVLYNPGNEEAAEQIAAELGGAEVREQPGTLSDAVAVHVVVGADRA